MTEKLLYWIPRVMGILAILFMMMFSLDCWGESTEWKKILLCFIMHNIPAFIIILVLVIAWKRELAGGILFCLVAVTGSIFFRGFSGNWGVLIVMAPFLISGALFILHNAKFGIRKNQQ